MTVLLDGKSQSNAFETLCIGTQSGAPYGARRRGAEGSYDLSNSLAVPRRGHVLSTVTEFYSAPIREAVSILSSALESVRQCSAHYERLFGAVGRSDALYEKRSTAEMAAWSLVSVWTISLATSALPVTASLADAEDWFLGSSAKDRITNLLPKEIIRSAERALAKRPDPAAYHQLLPYILDPHGPGSRLSVRRDPATRTTQARRRAEGVFYTPADVAVYLVAACFDSLQQDEPPTVLDPACGTGVFLRAALQALKDRYPGASTSALALHGLFGIDIDPWPLDAVAFVLLADIWCGDEIVECTPAALWKKLRQNFACFDALKIDPVGTILLDGKRGTYGNRLPLQKLFPALADGPQVIVGNPPYADLGCRQDLPTLARLYQTLEAKPHPGAEVYLAFLEQMTRLSGANQAAGALVLPLSIACNVGPQFRAARRLIQRTPGRWRFAFFDREPHALFGEDVKTRNTIVLWSKNPSDTAALIETGPLRKWRGDSRAMMFQSVRFTPVSSDIRGGIPKVDGECQAAALEVLSNRSGFLEQTIAQMVRVTLDQTPYADDKTVFVGPTAYNFINVFLKPPRDSLPDGSRLSEHALYAIRCASNSDALALFAILTSHLSYWWWHTHSDGFHVSKRFIASIPFGNEILLEDLQRKLKACGLELWRLIKTKPIISVNRGRTSLAYTPNGHDELRRNTDELLAHIAGLENGFVDELQQFTAHTVAATLRRRGENRINAQEGI